LNSSEEKKTKNFLIHLFRRGQYIFYTALVEKLVYFLIFLVLARKYSVSEFGAITSVFVLGFILGSLTELGFANYFQRQTASDFQTSIEEFNSALTFRFITYFIVLLISVSYVYYLGATIELFLTVIIVTSVFIFNSSWLLIKIFYGLNEYSGVFKRFLISRFILIAGSSLMIFADISLSVFSIVFLVSAISEFILLAVYLRQKKNYSIKITLKRKVLSTIFVSSIPMGLGVFFVMVYDRIDILLIQNIIGIESVGFYAVAYSIYKIPYIIGGAFFTPLYTDFSAEFEIKKKINYERIKKLGLFLVIFSILSITVIYFLSEFLIRNIYGEKYFLSAEILRWLIIALPFLFLNNLTGVTLNSIRKEKLAFYSAAIATLFNLVLNILLLNIMGIVGAVVSTVVTELLIFIIQLNYIMKFKFVFEETNLLNK
jgi:O-antigen/teichoic acid export membrane protein